MSYFYIPKNYSNLSTNIICTLQEDNNKSYSIANYYKKIEDMKKKYISTWKIHKDKYFYYKKVFNLKKDNHKLAITRFDAINKTFYVFWELNNIFNFMDIYNNILVLNTFHFSKCQPGIIQFLNHKRCNNTDYHLGIYGDEWRKNNEYLGIHKNIFFNEYVSYNFINHETLTYLTNNYIKKFDIITFLSNDECKELKTGIPNLMEKDVIMIKIIYSLIMLKRGGSLIFLIPELIDQTYCEALYFLSSCFNKVVITKPVLIENTTNRKIVICSEFIENYDTYILTTIAGNLINSIKLKSSPSVSLRLLDFQLPGFFLNKISEINVIMFQQTIDATLSVINLRSHNNLVEQLDKLDKKSIQKSMLWCIQNNFDYDHSLAEKIEEYI